MANPPFMFARLCSTQGMVVFVQAGESPREPPLPWWRGQNRSVRSVARTCSRLCLLDEGRFDINVAATPDEQRTVPGE